MEHYEMKLTLKVWRQQNNKAEGRFETYQVSNISSEMSFLEMFDVLNERLIEKNEEPIAFDHDCREGICGTCGVMINGQPHGPHREERGRHRLDRDRWPPRRHIACIRPAISTD